MNPLTISKYGKTLGLIPCAQGIGSRGSKCCWGTISVITEVKLLFVVLPLSILDLFASRLLGLSLLTSFPGGQHFRFNFCFYLFVNRNRVWKYESSLINTFVDDTRSMRQPLFIVCLKFLRQCKWELSNEREYEKEADLVGGKGTKRRGEVIWLQISDMKL